MQTVEGGGALAAGVMQKQLPPSEPIPPGFGPATPPWVWKLTYGLIGLVVGTLITAFAVVAVEKHMRAAERERQCWDPPKPAWTWAYPKIVAQDSNRAPLVCARRADNNEGVFPHSYRCLRMVPCEDK